MLHLCIVCILYPYTTRVSLTDRSAQALDALCNKCSLFRGCDAAFARMCAAQMQVLLSCFHPLELKWSKHLSEQNTPFCFSQYGSDGQQYTFKSNVSCIRHKRLYRSEPISCRLFSLYVAYFIKTSCLKIPCFQFILPHIFSLCGGGTQTIIAGPNDVLVARGDHVRTAYFVYQGQVRKLPHTLFSLSLLRALNRALTERGVQPETESEI
jgi:hypothetical protein